MDTPVETSTIPVEHKVGIEPLKGAELDHTLEALKGQKGLSPLTINNLLSIETAEPPRLSKLDKVVPAALMAGYIATYAARGMGAELPNADMPQALHWALEAVHNLTVNAAKTPVLREHLPFLFLEAAGSWVGARGAIEWIRGRTRQRIKEAQQSVTEQTTKGEFKYDMAPGHTAAFIGLGDPLADHLQQIKEPDQVMLYSHARIDNQVWQQLTKTGQQEQIYQALDRGDFQKAGEVLLLPVKYEDMFLPDKTGHDMTIDEIEALINVLDGYSTARGVDKKRVVIVGRKTMEETYVKRAGPEQQESYSTTLEELVDRLKTERGTEVEVIDPTELVMDKIVGLANGKALEFVATEESDKRYGQRFYEALSKRGYEPNSEEPVRILYNISDIPTEVGAQANDIAVILDPTRKKALIQKGINNNNIIVVPELVLKTISNEVEEPLEIK